MGCDRQARELQGGSLRVSDDWTCIDSRHSSRVLDRYEIAKIDSAMDMDGRG